MGLQEAIIFLGKIGVWDVLLPFLLVFALVYALLQKTRVLGEENNQPKKRSNALVATSIGLLVTGVVALVDTIALFLTRFALVLVAGFCVVLLLGFFGRTPEKPSRSVMIFLFATVLLILIYATGLLASVNLDALRNVIAHPLIIVTLVFVAVITYIVRDTDHSTQSTSSSSSSPKKQENQRDSPRQPPHRLERLKQIPGKKLYEDGYIDE